MSIFSQLLQEHFQEKKVKIYQIAQLSNIERTLLQKILTGSRKPSSEEQVTRLAQALMLTASETKELKKCLPDFAYGGGKLVPPQRSAKAGSKLSHQRFSL